MSLLQQSISRFQLELSSFQQTQLYQTVKRIYPNTTLIWSDFELTLYAKSGLFTDVQCIVTPISIQIFKENLKDKGQYMFHYDNRKLMELNGERFAESIDEFFVWLKVGEWFRNYIQCLEQQGLSYNVLHEGEFMKRNQLSYKETISFQQKIQLAAKDIQHILHIPTHVETIPYYSYPYWYNGVVAVLSFKIDEEVTAIHFDVRHNRLIVQGTNAFADEQPQIYEVVKHLMKERAYGQVAKALLKL